MNISNRLTAQKSPRVLAFKSARNYSYVNITQAYSATFRRFAGFNFPENRHTQPKGYSLSLKVDFVRKLLWVRQFRRWRASKILAGPDANARNNSVRFPNQILMMEFVLTRINVPESLLFEWISSVEFSCRFCLGCGR